MGLEDVEVDGIKWEEERDRAMDRKNWKRRWKSASIQQKKAYLTPKGRTVLDEVSVYFIFHEIDETIFLIVYVVCHNQSYF